MNKSKIGIGILFLVLLIVILNYKFNTKERETEHRYTDKIAHLKKENAHLTNKVLILSRTVENYQKVADRLRNNILSKEQELNSIKKEKNEKLNRIRDYNVDALYEYFSKFNTSDSLQ